MPKDKENLSAIREEARQMSSLESMLGQLSGAVQRGESISPSSRSRPRLESGVLQPEDHHMDMDGIVSKVNMSLTPQASSKSSKVSLHSSVDNSDLSKIVSDLASFSFSDNRKEEIKQIHEAMLKEMHNINIRRVVSNTRKNVKTAKNFYSAKLAKSGRNAIKVEFSLLNNKYAMLVDGPFEGNEILHPSVEGDEVKGTVLRVSDDHYENVTEDFKIHITDGWGS